MTLRPYQSSALTKVDAAHERVNRVCLVMPTGAGKSVVGREWVSDHAKRGPVLVLAHRIELLTQFRDHLDSVGVRSAVIAPGHVPAPEAPVQIASMDTLVSRGEVPEATSILVDECHHAVATTYQPILEALPSAKVLGLTATPQRSDGKPLGDLFDELIVGAQYSQLLKLGHICPVRVFRPERYLGSDFATEPVDAWVKHSEGRRGFAFCRTVKDARQLADDLKSRGVRAACVDGRMSDSERARIMVAFRAGDLDVLTNVYVLTEGVDVPSAEVCMLARSPQHAGTYLQMMGRVLRPVKGKSSAILIDLPGCSHPDMHGVPTSDREYALDGRAIKAKGESLKNCPQCQLTMPSAVRVCPECDFEFPRREYDGPKIWNLELVEFFEAGGDFEAAPKDLKKSEWTRLLTVGAAKGFGPGFALKEFERVFKEPPPKAWVKTIDDAERVRELRRLLSVQQSRGLKLGWISHAYKQTFGVFPSRKLRGAAGVPLPSEVR